MFTNTLKTTFLLFGLIALFTAIGGILGNQTGAMIGLIVAGCMSFYSYWFSDKMVIKAYKGQEVTDLSNPLLYKMVRNLADNANLPMPKIYIIPENQPNAFATGRNPNNSAVACTQGLLNMMNDNELKGVIAHELGHIKHRDILISTIAATFAGAIANIARFLPYSTNRRRSDDNDRNNNIIVILLASLLAPIAALIIQMSISRKREFMADRAGAEISGNPTFLSNALIKLEKYSLQIPMDNQNRYASHMFIVNPFSKLEGFQNLFRTHPTTEERVKELDKFARKNGMI